MGGAATAIALCPRCRGETLPAQLRSPLGPDAHRAADKSMVKKPDLRAIRIKTRKERKAAARATIRDIANPDESTPSRVTLYLKGSVQPPLSEECPDCIKLQKGLRARLLGCDPKTSADVLGWINARIAKATV